VSALDWSHKRKVLTEVGFTTWKYERRFFDAPTEAIYRDLEQLLPGYEITLQSANKNEDIFLVAAWNDRTQGTRYLYEAASPNLTKLAEIAPWLDENRLIAVKPTSCRPR